MKPRGLPFRVLVCSWYSIAEVLLPENLYTLFSLTHNNYFEIVCVSQDKELVECPEIVTFQSIGSDIKRDDNNYLHE